MKSGLGGWMDGWMDGWRCRVFMCGEKGRRRAVDALLTDKQIVNGRFGHEADTYVVVRVSNGVWRLGLQMWILD